MIPLPRNRHSMSVGDLIRHRFDGRWDKVGLVIDISQITEYRHMVTVQWCSCLLIRDYPMRDLEVVNAV